MHIDGDDVDNFHSFEDVQGSGNLVDELVDSVLDDVDTFFHGTFGA